MNIYLFVYKCLCAFLALRQTLLLLKLFYSYNGPVICIDSKVMVLGFCCSPRLPKHHGQRMRFRYWTMLNRILVCMTNIIYLSQDWELVVRSRQLDSPYITSSSEGGLATM
jgi:hypothetical protein